ncbi:MAG TPA: hypothetical protein VK804_16390 [Bradyrhizobium sp.]|uniref:hypothetical protein n=1 Tax=Bradyrhizobium sp. TaxID=376 RepID=UPI002D0E96A5|nr:hypothetical protein [Bradyrhizobium sp.]HTB02048.1 hypothetical protein [Bradyrhizobium sp.]
MTETADASAETLRLMSIMAAVNCGLAALGVAIAYYVYFYVPHSLEVHYTGRYGEVVSSVATYISVFPVFQIFVFVLSVIGRWGANRRHFPESLELRKGLQRPAPIERDKLYALVSLVGTTLELFGLVGMISRAVVLATQVV